MTVVLAGAGSLARSGVLRLNRRAALWRGIGHEGESKTSGLMGIRGRPYHISGDPVFSPSALRARKLSGFCSAEPKPLELKKFHLSQKGESSWDFWNASALSCERISTI
jgi:hypothetical protein